MKKIYSLNFLSRFAFLLLTPVFFQFFALGFIWHSIYWGVVTFVLAIWLLFLVLSPLLGRVGCGWFCFMGTVSDFAGQRAFLKNRWRKPITWLRVWMILAFFGTALTFYFLNKEKGMTNGFAFIPGFLPLNFDDHYKHVWMIDVFSASVLALLLNKRWMCKNLCFMGALCAAGAKHSRLISVVDLSKCTRCGKCEKECLAGIPILEYVRENQGLVTNSECLVCGKCAEVCKPEAVKLKFVWSRKKYRERIYSDCIKQQ